MIDFIVKLENMLIFSGYEDYEIKYIPSHDAYILELDGDAIVMTDASSILKEKENKNKNEK